MDTFTMTVKVGDITIERDGQPFYEFSGGAHRYHGLTRGQMQQVQNVLGQGERNTEDALAKLAEGAGKASAAKKAR